VSVHGGEVASHTVKHPVDFALQLFQLAGGNRHVHLRTWDPAGSSTVLLAAPTTADLLQTKQARFETDLWDALKTQHRNIQRHG